MPRFSTRGSRLVAALLLALTGCGDDTQMKDNLPRGAIAGGVTLDGQPLTRGRIQFDPVPGDKASTVSAVGEIIDGKFAIEKAKGLVPGNYKVFISSRPLVAIAAGQEPGERPKAEPEKVPARYNTQTTLVKEVSDSSSNNFDFELTGR